MKTIELSWKEYKVNGKLVEANLKASFAAVKGVSEDYTFKVHCADDLSEEDEQAIRDAWDAITEESEEATSWKSREDLEAEAEAAKEAHRASGIAKLTQLGLTAEEIAALRG